MEDKASIVKARSKFIQTFLHQCLMWADDTQVVNIDIMPDLLRHFGSKNNRGAFIRH